MSRTVKGIFLKDIVNIVKNEKGPEGLSKLEGEIGDINFSAFRDYPIETDKLLNEKAAEIIYGNSSPKTQFEFGKTAFKVYSGSAIGKTMFSLLGKDVKKVASSFGKILGTATSGLEVEVHDMGEKSLRFHMKNNPYNIRHYEGILFAAFEYFGENPKINAKELGEEDYQYDVMW